MTKENIIFSEADKKLQKKAISLKKATENISMREIARELKIKMQRLKQLLEPIGEWTPQQKGNTLSTNEMKHYRSRRSISVLNKFFPNSEPHCFSCGIKEWQNVPFVNIAQIDHVDGNKKNNDKTNLRPLCPNCHAMTTTRFRTIENHPSRDAADVSKKNMISSLDDILTSNELQKRLKTQSGTTRATPKNAASLDDILLGKVPTYRTSRLVDRLIGAKKKQACCDSCGLTKWRNIDIGLFLHGHHQNGNPTDHRLENIDILCPNCHSLEHRHENTSNPTLIGQEASFLSANPAPLNLDSIKVKAVKDLLEDPDRPVTMRACARKLNMSFCSLKRIALKLQLWKPDCGASRRLNIQDPVVIQQIKQIKEIIAQPGHTKYGELGLKQALDVYHIPKKRYLTIYSFIEDGETE